MPLACWVKVTIQATLRTLLEPLQSWILLKAMQRSQAVVAELTQTRCERQALVCEAKKRLSKPKSDRQVVILECTEARAAGFGVS